MVIFHKEVFKQHSLDQSHLESPFQLKVKFYFRNQNELSVEQLCGVSVHSVLGGPTSSLAL